MNHAEYYALLLFATAGMLMMAGSNELMMIFIGLEILSIATYVHGGLPANRSAIQRVGAEVLPARVIRFSILPLRRRSDFRRDRKHEPDLDRRGHDAPGYPDQARVPVGSADA